jgi:hypothetical protein
LFDEIGESRMFSRIVYWDRPISARLRGGDESGEFAVAPEISERWGDGDPSRDSYRSYD